MTSKWLFLIFIILVQPLTANIEAHFKKAPNKSGSHSMKNIDFIYMINLDERPEKFAASIQQLHPYNINPYRFSAVNGWKLTYSAINELGVRYTQDMENDLWGTSYYLENGTPHHEVMHVPGRTYFCHCMSRGAIGICLSHLSVLQDAYDSGYQTIWVMEDDIEVIRDPHRLSRLIEKLDGLVGKNGWDILFTDQDTKNQQGNYVPCQSFARKPNFTPQNQARFAARTTIDRSFRKIGARYGAYSMIVRRSGMEKILNFMKTHKLFLPYDMEFYLPDNIEMYAVVHDVVSTQPRALSDNGAAAYEKKQELQKK